MQIEVVTFSFLFELIFKVSTPPITYPVAPARINNADKKLFSLISILSENK